MTALTLLTVPGGRFRARMRRWLEPPRKLRPTRAGWVFFALLFGIAFAALNTGNNLLYLVLSFLLAFLILSGVLSESALRGIEVRRRLPGELYARSEARVLVEVHNSQRRVPSFAVVVEDLLTGSPGSGRAQHGGTAGESGLAPADARPVGRVFGLRVGPGESEARLYRMHPEQRGPLHFWGYRVSTRFPFGLFLKSRTIRARESCLVYPQVSPMAPRPPASDPAQEQSGERPQQRDGGSQVTGLRDYATGDPLRRVHWRSSLRRQSLLVRELDDERDAEIEVRLRTRGYEPGSGEAETGSTPPAHPASDRFEAAVAWAASEVAAHLARDLRVGLVTDEERLRPAAGAGQRQRLLGFLALVQPAATRSSEPRPAARADGRGGAGP
ncbi:MAG: DUF58 domain-containing protein [Deltaproteobacteria bacterium]|nr:DUF58 domain-containing protein [Deltaproteobacteria bacterium]